MKQGRSRRYGVGLIVVAAAVASLGGTVHAGAATRPAAISITTQGASPDTIPGGAAEVLVNLANIARVGGTAAQSPSFTIAAPAGYVFDGSVNLDRVPGFSGFGIPTGHVACRRSPGGATCTYGGALAASGTLSIIARFKTPASAKPGGRALFRIAGGGSATGKNATARVGVVAGPGAPILYTEVQQQNVVRLDKPGSEIVDVLNVGPTAATSVQLTDLLPASVVGTWSASGSGWTCTGAQGSPPACTNSHSIRPGDFAPRLRITFAVDATRVEALHLQVGGAPSIQDWNVGVTSTGGVRTYTVTSPAELAVMPQPGSVLNATAIVKGGHQELLPGDQATIEGRLSNIGGGPTEGTITLEGSIPGGTSIERIDGIAPWVCQGGEAPTPEKQSFSCAADNATIGPGKFGKFTILLKASADAHPGLSAITFTATTANQVATATPKSATLSLEILEGNVGFPALTLLRPTGKHGAFAPVNNGAPAKLISGLPFTERLDVRNAGGASINPGETATLEQTLGGGARVKSIQNAPGWSCSGTVSLTCTVAFGAALAPAKSLTGPVIVIDAGAATKAERSWPASIRLTGATAPHAYKLPVLVTVTHGESHLIPDFTNIRVPTAGGTGAFGLSVRNSGDIATAAPVVLSIHLPHGVRFTSLGESGWSCDTAATSARCTSAGPLQAGHHLPHLKLNLSFARGTELKTLSIEARAGVGSHAAPKSSRAAIQVEPRHTLRAVIKEPDKVAFADQPIVKANEKLKPTVLTLEGDGSGGSGLGLHYRWTQRSGPAVTWLGPRNEADVQFSTPQVTTATPVVFGLTVNDGSASSSDSVRIKIVPLPSSSSGFAIRDAHPKAEKPDGPMSEKRSLPKPAEQLTKTTKKAPRIPATASTATDTTTTTATTTAATTTAGTTTSGTTTGGTTTSGSSLPPIFCQLVRDALNSSGSFSGTVGGVSFGFDSVRVSGSDCSPDTTVSFSGSTFGTSSLKATGVDGSISPTGLTITAGTLTGPEAWHSPTFTLGGAGLSIPFGGGTVSLNGTIKADGFAFVPLPSGWSGSTTLAFQAGGTSGTSVSVDTTATGPKSDASPDSPVPSAEIQGTVASDGTFSLSVNVQQIVQLAGSPVNLSGSVKRDSPDGAITASFEGSITKPITIVKGLTINTLTVKMEPTDTSLGLTGSGQLALSTPNGTAAVDIKLAYDNPKNWSLTATGAGDATWNPLPGLTIGAKDFSGAIVAHDDKYDLTLKVAPSADWKPSSNVTISNLELTLSNQCPDTGAPCPASASLFFALKGNVAFALPVIGTVNTTIAGSLALPTGEFSVKASLTQPLSIAAGIQITNASVLIQRGMKAPAEDPSAETSDKGDFRVDLQGAISVPGIGQLPTVHASFGSQGWAIAVPLGTFSLPGGSGDGSKLGSAVIGWSSFATKLDVVDPVTKAVTKIPLTPGAFKLTGSFTTPGWLKTTLGLKSDVNGRATGVFDPDHDTYSLRMDFATPGQPYLYGNATSKSNVKLNSTYFEVSRSGGSFNIALGGAATMNVVGGGGTASSSADVSIALGYAVTSNTVTGTFSLTSQDGWANAFGVKDLRLYKLDIQFGLTLTLPLPLPSIGFGATAQLPGLWQSKLGLANNPKTTLVANISVTNPCIAIQVEDPTNTGQNVINLGNGAVTATAFDVEVAPTGCTVGQFKYQPGVSLNFAGTIAGVSVAIKAAVLLNPFSFTASADIGEFNVAGLTVKKTHIDVALSPSAFKVNFAGGISVGGTDVDIAGGINKSGAVLITDFTGTLNQLNLGSGAVTANNLAVTIHTETGAGKANAKFTMSGAVQILGSTANGNFTLSIQNGQLSQLVSDITANIVLGGTNGLNLNGTFHVNYQPGQPFSLTANVNATFAGQPLANVSVNLQPGYLQIGANFSIGSVFSAQLQGAAYYGTVPKGTTIAIPGGATVAAQTGDFLISAKDVTLSLAGFTGKATVYLAKAGGVTQGGLSGSVQVLGTGTGNSVNVSGTFASNGNFTLAGSAVLNMAGFNANAAVSIAKVGANVTVSGSAAIGVLGSTVNMSGTFAYTGGQYRYRLNGSANIAPGGYQLANTAFKFSNFPEDAGMWATVNFTAGSVLRVNGTLNVDSSGGFFLNANAYMNLGVTVYGNVTFSASRSQPANLTVAATIGYNSFSFGVNVRVGGDGSFSATIRSPTSGIFTGTTPTVSLIVVRGYAYISYAVSLTVQSRSPQVSFAGSGSAGIKYQHWDVRWWPWESGWSGWNNGPSISLSISAPPFKACGYVSLFGKDVGGCVGH